MNTPILFLYFTTFDALRRHSLYSKAKSSKVHFAIINMGNNFCWSFWFALFSDKHSLEDHTDYGYRFNVIGVVRQIY